MPILKYFSNLCLNSKKKKTQAIVLYYRYSIQIDTITTRKYPNVSLEYLKFANLSK